MEEGEYPTLEKLMDAITNSKELSDKERQELISSLFKDSTPGMPVPLPEPPLTHQTMLLGAMLLLVALIFGIVAIEHAEMSEADVLRGVLKGFKKLGENVGLGEDDNEAANGLLEQIITGYQELSEEEKAKFRQSAKDEVVGRFQGALTSHISNAFYTKFGVLAVCVIVILLLFVFFGYKLIKSIKDKEKKKEEKKKQKQSKKKK